MKLISIIIPCYNASKYIDKCVQSLINQTIQLEHLELIFVNDASTDDTYNKLVHFESLYTESILVINLEENIKQGGARNIGLSYATAPYIAFVDADDWVEPNMYEELFHIIDEYKCDLVSTDFYFDTGFEVKPHNCHNGNTGLVLVDTDEKRRNLLVNSIGLFVWTKLYNKKFLLEHGIFFPEKLYYEDNFFSDLYLPYVNSYYIVDKCYYHYFVNFDSTVHRRNSTHHFDRLTVELLKLEEYKSRNLLEKYHEEIMCKFVRVFYLNTINIMLKRFDTMPHGVYIKMTQTLKKIYPGFRENLYLKPLEIQWLEVLADEISPDELCQIHTSYNIR